MVQYRRQQVVVVYGEVGPSRQIDELEGCRWTFSTDWKSQWDISEDKIIPDNHLSPYKNHIMGGRKIVLSKFNADTYTSGQKLAAKAAADILS